jgi:hypothetical protein
MGTLCPSTAGLVASRSVFETAFKSVVRSPESFFDTNPIGMPLFTDVVTCLTQSKDEYCRVYQRIRTFLTTC